MRTVPQISWFLRTNSRYGRQEHSLRRHAFLRRPCQILRTIALDVAGSGHILLRVSQENEAFGRSGERALYYQGAV